VAAVCFQILLTDTHFDRMVHGLLLTAFTDNCLARHNLCRLGGHEP